MLSNGILSDVLIWVQVLVVEMPSYRSWKTESESDGSLAGLRG